MARTLRNETAAHFGMEAHANAQAQTREDWRRVLARRDSKRAAVRNARPMRRQSGAVLLPMLVAIVSACVSVLFTR